MKSTRRVALQLQAYCGCLWRRVYRLVCGDRTTGGERPTGDVIIRLAKTGGS